MKVVVFCGCSLSKRLEREMCLDQLAQRIDVEFWNIDAITWPKQYSPVDSIEQPYCRVIKDINDLQDKLCKLPESTIGIRRLPDNEEMYKVFRIISRKIKTMVRFRINRDMPVMSQRTSTRKQNPFIKSIKDILYRSETIYLLCKWLKFRGGKGYQIAKNNVARLKIERLFPYYYSMGIMPNSDLRICHPDFDTIIQLDKQDERVCEEPYYVFLDSYYPHHPDYRNRVSTDVQYDYYESLKCFFDEVEKKEKCKIVIAAHPNSNYKNNPYGEREMYKYKSVPLVKHSQGVILHASNSVNFISWYNKPVCIVVNDALKQDILPGSLYEMAIGIASTLGIKPYDIDHERLPDNLFCKINEEKRQELASYLGDTSELLTECDLIIRHFKRIEKK